MPDVFEPELMVLYGAVILRQYRHPTDWEDGGQTGKQHLRGAKVLKVEEIRLGKLPFGIPPIPTALAEYSAQCIAAWARAVGLTPDQFRIDQQPDKAPYIYVPKIHWNRVLPLLQQL